VLSGVVGIQEEVAITDQLLVYPNPTINGKVAIQSIKGQSIEEIEVYDASGKLVESLQNLRHQLLDIELPQAKGYYFINVHFQSGSEVKRVLRL